MLKKILIILIFSNLFWLNYLEAKTFRDLVADLNSGLFNKVMIILVSLSVIAVLYQAFKLVMNLVNGKSDIKENKPALVLSVVLLSVLAGMWGLINIALNTFNLDHLNDGDIRIEIQNTDSWKGYKDRKGKWIGL